MTAFEKLPASAQAYLSDRGFPPSLFDQALDLPPQLGILLVGSHAEGMATAISDLDFLVLLEPGEQLTSPGGDHVGTPGSSASFLERYLILAEGLELDLEVVERGGVSTLRELMQATRVLDEDADAAGGLPALQPLELRFLSRLRSGIVLSGEARVADWREWLRLAQLPAYAATAFFVRAMSYLEDAYSLAAMGDDEQMGVTSSAIAARAAADALVAAALAVEGVVLGYDLKHAPKHLRRISSAGRPLAPPLHDLPALLFPPADAAGGEYRDRLHGHCVAYFEHLTRRREYSGVVRFLRAFGRDRWALDLAFLQG